MRARRPTRRTLLPALTGLAILAAACGGGASVGAAPPASERPAEPTSTPEPQPPPATADTVELDDLEAMLPPQEQLGAAAALLPRDDEYWGPSTSADAAAEFDGDVTAVQLGEMGRLGGFRHSYVDPGALESRSGVYWILLEVELFDEVSAADAYVAFSITDLYGAKPDPEGSVIAIDARSVPIDALGDGTWAFDIHMEFDGGAGAPLPTRLTRVTLRLDRLLGNAWLWRADEEEGVADAAAIAEVLRDRMLAVMRGEAVTERDAAFATEAACEGVGPRVCLVTVSGYDGPPPARLAAHLESIGVPTALAAPVAIAERLPGETPASIAVRIEEAVVERYPDVAADPAVSLIALTAHSVGTTNEDGPFGARGKRVAVASTAGLDEAQNASGPDPSRVEPRLNKLVERYAAIYHLGQPLTDEPISVLHQSITGTGDIDRMVSGAVTAQSAGEATAALREWAQAVCRPLVAYDAQQLELLVAYFANVAQQGDNPDAVLSAVYFLLSGDLDASFELYSQLTPAVEIASYSEEIAPEVRGLTEALFTMYEAYIEALGAASDGMREEMSAGEAVGVLTALAVDFGLHPTVLRLVEELETLSPNARAALRDAGDCGVLTQDGSPVAPGLQI